MEEKKLARKIQGWLPDDKLDLGVIARKLRFLGLSLSDQGLMEDLLDGEVVGAGQIVLELSDEVKTIDNEYTEFVLKLCELTTGRKFSSIQKSLATGDTQ